MADLKLKAVLEISNDAASKSIDDVRGKVKTLGKEGGDSLKQMTASIIQTTVASTALMAALNDQDVPELLSKINNKLHEMRTTLQKSPELV